MDGDLPRIALLLVDASVTKHARVALHKDVQGIPL